MTTPDGTQVYVPVGEHWEPAPAGWTPPLAWLPVPGGWVPSPPGFLPPPGWVPTPSGWLPPPGTPPLPWAGAASGGPNAAVRGLGWPRVLPSRAQTDAARADRVPSGWEIVVVLLVFPAAAVFAAIASLAQSITGTPQSGGYVDALLPHQPWIAAVILTLVELSQFAPAVLAAYLLSTSGGGLRAIGLDLTQPRADLARCGKLYLLAFIGPIYVVAGILGAVQGFKNPGTAHLPKSTAYLIPLLVASVGAGVVEEIVVLGYLVHRLEQRGWSGWQLVAVCTLVRGSYHLYYGVAVLGFMLWGALSVILYRYRRRLLTFVVLHALFDCTSFIAIFLHGAAQTLPLLGLVIALLVMWVVGRGPAVAEMRRSRAQLDLDPGATSLPA